jgi:formate-dependent nitrite reductase cytochrome c552 subunit
MYTTFHLTAQELTNDIVEVIKNTFKTKRIKITVEEEDEYDEYDQYDNYDNDEITDDMKAILDERLQEDQKDYITAEESINVLKKKYGL